MIVRTEYQAPREHLAERLNLSYEDLVHIVFESETAREASLGRISTQQHWEALASRLGRPPSEATVLRDEFFAGDVLDRELLAFIRSLRPAHRTGLISNAWSNLREYITKNHFADAFDTLVISAEVGLLKPDPRMYELALERLAVGPGQAVMVDDMPSNVAAARSLGMRGIVFQNTAQTVGELQALLGQ